ncbi:MAG: hypothetical protein WED07_03275 [Candidatus Freyarchaeum deiterrae]
MNAESEKIIKQNEILIFLFERLAFKLKDACKIDTSKKQNIKKVLMSGILVSILVEHEGIDVICESKSKEESSTNYLLFKNW